jgi:Protein of unknown function (DUF1225).
VKRTNVVKLVVDKNIHEKLKELAVVTAKCWNEVNWLRMQQFKKGGESILPRQKRRYMRSTNKC